MSLDIIAEIWDNVKPSINPVDRRDAAEAVVATLFENNYEIDDIRYAFRGDSDIKRAVKQYAEEHLEEEEEEEEYEEEDERW